MAIRNCIKCDKQYNTLNKRVGLFVECNNCGEETDKDTPRKKGIMIYSHKTAGEIEIGDASHIDSMRKMSERNGGQGTLRNIVERKS